MLTNTVYIRTTAHDLWQALTDGEHSVKYVGARVQSTWRPGDEIVFVFECRLLMDPALAADQPHRELFEIEDMGGGICRCTAVFDQYAADSATFRFQAQGSMQMCGSSLKSLLETGQALEFKTPATVDA
jgi:hypothetical protein